MVPGDPLCRATSPRLLQLCRSKRWRGWSGEGRGTERRRVRKIGRRQAGRMEGSKVVRLTAGWRLVGGFKVEPGGGGAAVVALISYPQPRPTLRPLHPFRGNPGNLINCH